MDPLNRVTPTIVRLWRLLIGQWIKRRIKQPFPGSKFVGPYEQNGIWEGIWEEQWLWAHRDLIRGVVLDMSTPRALHEYLYHLPAVVNILISDLTDEVVSKWEFKSPTDIVGDFGRPTLPVGNATFDTVLCLSILEHCENPSRLVHNIAAILRSQGIAFFWCPFAYPDGHLHPDRWRFCQDGYLLLAEKAGLEVLETGGYEDLGRYFLLILGRDMRANSWHRGVPVANWMICKKL